MTNQQGQTLTEALITLPVLISFLFGFLCTGYSIYAREVSSYILYRSLICTEELNKNTNDCFINAEKKLKQILFFHKDIQVIKKLNRNHRKAKLKASFLNFKTVYKKNLKVNFQ